MAAPKYLQRDAFVLDALLASALADGVHAAAEKVVGPAAASARRPETALLAHSAVFLLPALVGRPTPAQRATGLQFGVGPRNLLPLPVARLLGVLLLLGGQYGVARLRQWAREGAWEDQPRTDPRRQASTLLDAVGIVWGAAKLVVALRFLVRGDHVSVPDALVGLRQVAGAALGADGVPPPTPLPPVVVRRPQLYGMIAFQLGINALKEFSQAVRTLADWPAVVEDAQRSGDRAWRRVRSRILAPAAESVRETVARLTRPRQRVVGAGAGAGAGALQPAGGPGADADADGEAASSSSRESMSSPTDADRRRLRPPPVPCALCGSQRARMPLRALPCRHTFCYFCLHASMLQDSGFECPECLEAVAGAEDVGEGRRGREGPRDDGAADAGPGEVGRGAGLDA
jgi:hypothetical protein